MITSTTQAPVPRLQGTDSVAPAERLEHWRDIVSRAFVPLAASATQAAEFSGRLRITPLGSTIVSRVDAGAHTVRRSRSLIAHSERGYYKLGLQLRGEGLLIQDGREVVLGPGDLALYDTDLPYTLDFGTPTDTAVFMFPRERLHLPAQIRREVLARRIRAHDEIGTLLTPLLLRLVDQCRGERPHAALTIADAVVDLLAALLTDDFGTPQPPSQQTLLVQAKAFIDDNLADPDLNPDLVAARRRARLHPISAETVLRRRTTGRRLDSAPPPRTVPARAGRTRPDRLRRRGRPQVRIPRCRTLLPDLQSPIRDEPGRIPALGHRRREHRIAAAARRVQKSSTTVPSRT